LFERYQGGEQAILVHVDFKDEAAREDLRELEMLATSAGATILGTITTRRDSPQAKFFIGTGKADEIAQNGCTGRRSQHFQLTQIFPGSFILKIDVHQNSLFSALIAFKQEITPQ
jgi:hypothetical protein